MITAKEVAIPRTQKAKKDLDEFIEYRTTHLGLELRKKLDDVILELIV
jgi:uncharacterized FlaG/YvyC family protein